MKPHRLPSNRRTLEREGEGVPQAGASLLEVGPMEEGTEKDDVSRLGDGAAIRDAPQRRAACSPFPFSCSQPVPPISQHTRKPEGNGPWNLFLWDTEHSRGREGKESDGKQGRSGSRSHGAPNSWWMSSKPSRNNWFLSHRNYSGTPKHTGPFPMNSTKYHGMDSKRTVTQKVSKRPIGFMIKNQIMKKSTLSLYWK